MTTPQQDSPRTNRLGQPCPTWCTTKHDMTLIDGRPEFGFLDLHNSDPMARGHFDGVVVSRLPQEERAKVRLSGSPMLRLTPEEADSLAQLLEDRHSLAGIASLIDELRDAAQIARDTDALEETKQ